MRTPRLSLLAIAFVALSVVASLGACGGTDAKKGTPQNRLDLEGRTFVGDDVSVDDQPYSLVKGSQLRVSFGDQNIGAQAGCNSMGGDASWAGGVLVVDGKTLVMTEMGCDEALMQQDTWFADVLTSKPTLSQSASTLTITSGGTVIVLTDKEVALPDASLTGTLWRLDSIVSGDSASSVPSGVESTLELNDSGDLTADLGCNSGRGRYSARGNTLTIGPIATTRKTCTPPASEVEAAVLGLLQGDVSYSIDGDSLNLTARKVVGPGPTRLVYRSS
jgi:heat shock protein HslJ